MARLRGAARRARAAAAARGPRAAADAWPRGAARAALRGWERRLVHAARIGRRGECVRRAVEAYDAARPRVPAGDIGRLSPNTLAYVGDSVLELFWRSRTLWPPVKLVDQQKRASRRVRSRSAGLARARHDTRRTAAQVVEAIRAEAQADAVGRLLAGPGADGFELSDAEKAWFKRGRNASRPGVCPRCPTPRCSSRAGRIAPWAHAPQGERLSGRVRPGVPRRLPLRQGPRPMPGAPRGARDAHGRAGRGALGQSLTSCSSNECGLLEGSAATSAPRGAP